MSLFLRSRAVPRHHRRRPSTPPGPRFFPSAQYALGKSRGATFRAALVQAGGGTPCAIPGDRRRGPSSRSQSSQSMRDLRASLEPFKIGRAGLRSHSFEVASHHDGRDALTHLPSGCRLGSTRCMTLRSKNASIPCMPRLLVAAHHRARPPMAARGGGSSQEKHRKRRSLTSPCTAGRG